MKISINKGCPFCNFSDPEVVVYDDKLVFAVISLKPINGYHVMIIPKRHYESFTELPDDIASHIFLLAKRVSTAVARVCDADAITHVSDDDFKGIGHNLLAHYKFHIIPRFKDDKVEINWNREEASAQDRSAFARQFHKEFSRG